jgi:DNA-binding response OmpR family regulator
MALTPQPLSRFNLEDTAILILQGSVTETDIYAQMLSGFGAKSLHRTETKADAMALLARAPMDLIVVDARLPDGDGYEFVAELRRSAGNPNIFAPVLMLSGHTPRSKVERARDCGAHFVISKPVSPVVLLERILWIARETRIFVECEAYVGPERRFKFEGPPDGVGRRRDDLSADVGAAVEPNLDQTEVDQLMQPKKVAS